MLNDTRLRRMKRLSLFLMCSAVMLLSLGCAGKDARIILRGESLHWKGQFDTSVDHKQESGNYTFYYKDDDWQDVRAYTFDINDKRTVIKEEGLAERTVTVPITRSNGPVSSGESQPVIVQWSDTDGNQFEETLQLEG